MESILPVLAYPNTSISVLIQKYFMAGIREPTASSCCKRSVRSRVADEHPSHIKLSLLDGREIVLTHASPARARTRLTHVPYSAPSWLSDFYASSLPTGYSWMARWTSLHRTDTLPP